MSSKSLPIIITVMCTVFISCNKHESTDPQVKTALVEVLTHDGVDSVLNTLKKVSIDDLDPEYVAFAEMDGEFKDYYSKADFYLVGKEDLGKVLVGKHRIFDFVPNDAVYKSNRFFAGKPVHQPLMISRKVLHKFVDLLNTLKERGYRHRAMYVYHGFRHPRDNREVGGSSLSVHMRGLAIDIRIFDMNGDGDINWDDKVIVIDILDKEIIKDEGGIGRYPHSQGIHFDVRGYKARWDTY